MLKAISTITNALGALNYKGTWNASTNNPALADGTGAKGDYYVPLATSEAALVASYGRGARLISSVGGCTTGTLAEGVHRSPGHGGNPPRHVGGRGGPALCS